MYPLSDCFDFSLPDTSTQHRRGLESISPSESCALVNRPEAIMKTNRRDFLRGGLMAAGAAVAGGAASSTSEPTPAGPTTPALTTDHKLVHVHGNGRVSLNVLPA